MTDDDERIGTSSFESFGCGCSRVTSLSGAVDFQPCLAHALDHAGLMLRAAAEAIWRKERQEEAVRMANREDPPEVPE